MNVLDLLIGSGISSKKAASTKGGEYHSACPGCGGNDRFHVWPQQNDGSGSYWCRGCGKSGDNIQFLIDFEGLTYPEACRQLEIEPQKTYLKAPRMPQKARPQAERFTPKKPADPGELWSEKAEAFVSYSHEQLLSNPAEIEHLKHRGINLASIKAHRLGYNPKDRWRPRPSWGVNDGSVKKLWFPQGLVIPRLDESRVLRIRIRRPEGEPRYYVIPGSSPGQTVFNPGQGAAVVVESELDAILIHQEVKDVSVIGLGSASVYPDEKPDETLKTAAIILLALDFDDAGIKAAKWWKSQYPQIKLRPVPEGKDPGDAFQNGIDIREWIESGLPPPWKTRPSLLGKKERGEGREQPSAKPDSQLCPVPTGILKLAEHLKGTPVALYNLSDRLHLSENRKWARQNWEKSREISKLVFLDPAVFQYVIHHPADKITAKNLINQQK